MALYTHLWTGGPAPLELVNVRFYREFGWTPEELRRQPLGDVLDILAVWEVEGRVAAAKRTMGNGKK